ncbi:hypothetical protein CSUI_006430 [Cystoisospora suis]|uniref:Uncharacterized protein n=1 Tax=Cystoisospora suis TaxID=483139 RepID=A0A2C6KTZ1_9APIC|nr:hypothetical protein CSUI_006430 [Cystoisospora suis]
MYWLREDNVGWLREPHRQCNEERAGARSVRVQGKKPGGARRQIKMRQGAFRWVYSCRQNSSFDVRSAFMGNHLASRPCKPTRLVWVSWDQLARPFKRNQQKEFVDVAGRVPV